MKSLKPGHHIAKILQFHNRTDINRYLYLLFEITFLQEGQFVWLSGDPIVFNSYETGQPDNVDIGGTAEADCIEFGKFIPSQWRDVNCNRDSKIFCWNILEF